jgi:hypothetical protein
MSCLDNGLTLFWQPPAYWSGDYNAANEISPSFREFLTIHPLMFVAMTLVWMGVFSTLIALLPQQGAKTVAVTVVMGHMIGAGSWPPFRGSYQFGCALILLTSIVIVQCTDMGHSIDGKPSINWQRTGLPFWTKWILVLFLFAMPVWWFLIPH